MDASSTIIFAGEIKVKIMRILIDIGHPAHVHYFKNFIKIMEQKGNKFLITARDKEMTHYLLQTYKIDYFNRGKGSNSIFGKLKYLPKGVLAILKYSRKFKPDIFLSFSSPYAAQASLIMNKPHIAFDDTEHAKFSRLLYRPFTNIILSPSCFKTNLGKKQVRFNSYMELCYLHKNYYRANFQIKKILGLKDDEKYVVLRFVAWQGNHDIGHKGISDNFKVKIVEEFSRYAKVFITSESKLPEKIKKYELNLPFEKIHDVLASANLFFGESATMASESAVLGIPAIYIDDVGRGYTDEQELKYGLVFNFSESYEDQKKALSKGIDILRNYDSSNWKGLGQKLIREKIDITALLVWLIKEYPESYYQLKNNTELHYNFY